MNINNDDEVRVKNLETRMHPVIQEKIKFMFIDWYRKKYLGLYEVRILIQDNEEVIMHSNTKSATAL